MRCLRSAPYSHWYTVTVVTRALSVQITTMSLEKSSYAEVNTTREEGYDISFRFKTTLGNGLLAMGRGLTYFFLELSNGRLNLHSSLLNKWEGVFIGSNLNDSNWQKVQWKLNYRTVRRVSMRWRASSVSE